MPAEIFGGTEDYTLKLLYGINASRVNMAYSNISSSGVGEASAASLDFASGTIRFERVEQADWTASGATGGYPRTQHARVLAKGTFDSTGNFTSVTSLEGAATGMWASASGSTVTGASANILTMKGNPTDGIRTHNYNLTIQNAGTIPSHTTKQNLDECDWPSGPMGSCTAIPERNACFGADDATCAGNDGIKIAAEADLTFLQFPDFAFSSSPKYVSPTEFITGTASRLEFDAVRLTE